MTSKGDDLLGSMASLEARRCMLWSDPASGLRALAVVDDVTLGPAAGGIRTQRYPTLVAALREAHALARAMTIKCALAGLDAGGCKIVVLDHDQLVRDAAFERLGEHIAELGGLIRTAGDLGTSADDLEAAARRCPYVHGDEGTLSNAVARGLLRCVEACARLRGVTTVEGLRVGVQGCGVIGAAVARELAMAGATLLVADRVADKAEQLASELGATVEAPQELLSAELDVLCPCAIGGVISEQTACAVRAWAVVGAANNILTDARAGERLAVRGIAFVPDPIASAGAVIEGVGRTVMGMADRTPLVDRLGETAELVLTRARREGRTPSAVAIDMAEERIAAARRSPRRSQTDA